jgi:hypothetical protein
VRGEKEEGRQEEGKKLRKFLPFSCFPSSFSPFLVFFAFFFGTVFDIIKITITFAHSFTRTQKERVVIKKTGGVPEWLNGTDCNSVRVFFRWFESIRPHNHSVIISFE